MFKMNLPDLSGVYIRYKLTSYDKKGLNAIYRIEYDYF